LIALSDLLPEVQFHRHNRVSLFLALLFGIVLMGCIALLEEHKHAPSIDSRRHLDNSAAVGP
jgi:zinc and cadmium transporter